MPLYSGFPPITAGLASKNGAAATAKVSICGIEKLNPGFFAEGVVVTTGLALETGLVDAEVDVDEETADSDED